MYNAELKNQYITEKNKEVVMPNNYLECQFNKSCEMEMELGKDISNFTFYEIIEYFKLINSSSFNVIQVLNSQLGMYTQWCLQNNLVIDNQNHYLELTKELLKDCINKAVFDRSIVSKETIYKWIDELPNPKDQFILLSLFEFGKSKNFMDIVEAKISDFNGNKLILQSKREVVVSDKLRRIAYDSYAEDTYYSISGKGAKKMPLIPNEDRIVKGYPNVQSNVGEFQKGRVIYNAITRILNYFDVLDWCSANSITESGKINMIKEKASELNMTPLEYIYSENIYEVEKQYGCNIVRSIFITKYEEHLK